MFRPAKPKFVRADDTRRARDPISRLHPFDQTSANSLNQSPSSTAKRVPCITREPLEVKCALGHQVNRSLITAILGHGKGCAVKTPNWRDRGDEGEGEACRHRDSLGVWVAVGSLIGTLHHICQPPPRQLPPNTATISRCFVACERLFASIEKHLSRNREQHFALRQFSLEIIGKFGHQAKRTVAHIMQCFNA